MRILIFGTGKVYERYKGKLRDDIIIVGFLDNDKGKQGKYFEGKKIYSPQEAVGLEYDFIFLMIKYMISTGRGRYFNMMKL